MKQSLLFISLALFISQDLVALTAPEIPTIPPVAGPYFNQEGNPRNNLTALDRLARNNGYQIRYIVSNVCNSQSDCTAEGETCESVNSGGKKCTKRVFRRNGRRVQLSQTENQELTDFNNERRREASQLQAEIDRLETAQKNCRLAPGVVAEENAKKQTIGSTMAKAAAVAAGIKAAMAVAKTPPNYAKAAMWMGISAALMGLSGQLKKNAKTTRDIANQWGVDPNYQIPAHCYGLCKDGRPAPNRNIDECSCQNQRDCWNGQICGEDNTCHSQCQPICEDNQTCRNGTCINNNNGDEEPECGEGKPACPGGKVCREGQCQNSNSDDDNACSSPHNSMCRNQNPYPNCGGFRYCPPGQIYNRDSGACFALQCTEENRCFPNCGCANCPSEAPCRAGGDRCEYLYCKDGSTQPCDCDNCPAGWTCKAGEDECTPPAAQVRCTDQEDCSAENQVCHNNQCTNGHICDGRFKPLNEPCNGRCTAGSENCSCSAGGVQCQSPQQCIERKCQAPQCGEGNSCADGKVCKDGQCVVPECSSNQNCNGGKICLGQICVCTCNERDSHSCSQICPDQKCPAGSENCPCTGDSKCRLPQICLNNNKCGTPSSQCRPPEPCEDDETCRNNACVQVRCTSQTDCRTGEICAHGNCVRNPDIVGGGGGNPADIDNPYAIDSTAGLGSGNDPTENNQTPNKNTWKRFAQNAMGGPNNTNGGSSSSGSNRAGGGKKGSLFKRLFGGGKSKSKKQAKKENNKKAMAGFKRGGGGGGSAGGGGSFPNSDGSFMPSSFASQKTKTGKLKKFKNSQKKRRRIGLISNNIFNMIHQRYQKKRKKYEFVEF